MHFLPLYSHCKQPLNQRNMCETANASYIIMLFHHILWDATLCLCLDRWTTKCVPIRGLYSPSVNNALDYMCQSVWWQFHPPHLFQTNAFLLLQTTILRDLQLRTYLNGSNLLNGLNQCPTPVNQEWTRNDLAFH